MRWGRMRRQSNQESRVRRVRPGELQAILTGEQVAISVLQDVKNTRNEFRTGGGGFTFHDFRGNSVSI